MKVIQPALAALLLMKSSEAHKVSNYVSEFQDQNDLTDDQYLNLDMDAPEDVELLQRKDAKKDEKKKSKKVAKKVAKKDDDKKDAKPKVEVE